MRPFRELFAGSDGPGKKALPAGEFLHPVPLAALAVLVVNDHLLKGSGSLPGWLTGKLSDAAGLLFFPLLVTAACDCVLWGVAQLGFLTDFSLRRGKLAVALLATAALFIAIKLSGSAAAAFATAFAWFGMSARALADATDLFALPVLLGAAWLGRREIARVPLGRLEWIERMQRAGKLSSCRAELADVAACGGDAAAIDVFARALDTYLDRPQNAQTRDELRNALRNLRAR